MADKKAYAIDPAAVARAVAELKARPIIRSILERLRRELPPNLYYHAVGHTEDVLTEAALFGLVGKVSPAELDLLAIAAAYHDAGYLERYFDNEVIGARMARAAMEAEHFSTEQIAAVERMVLDTRLVNTGWGHRQIATTGLSRYLLDADLSNFGRADFFEKGELQRLELGIDRERFLRRTFALISSHSWQTDAARELRQPTKEDNIRKLGQLLQQSIEVMTEAHRDLEISTERLAFLARLPLLLNSSLDTRMVISVALRHLKEVLGAEAATVFLLNEARTELKFWALEGGKSETLQDRVMSAKKGIVGWVIEKHESVLVENAHADPRFFSEIDRAEHFTTRNVMCVPLTVRGDCIVGALQVLNRTGGGTFDRHDLMFLEQFGNQAALALDNAALFERTNARTLALEQLERQRADAMAVLAHEFRTPLSIIQTAGEILSGEFPVEPRVRSSMVETLRRGIARLAKIVSEVRTAAQVAWSGGLDSAALTESVSVDQLVSDVRNLFEPICRERGLEFTVRIHQPGLTVRGDAGLLFVALKNLASNAVRFTPRDGRVAIEAGAARGLVEIAVVDTGVGIAPEHHAAVFESLFEGGDVLEHSSGEHAFGSGGLGLGLSTARAIARHHGGSIDLESAPGRGSRFTVRLPIAEEKIS